MGDPGYPEDAVVRIEDFGPIERAYAEAMHEDCPDGDPHPLSDHSPWSGGDLDGAEPWEAFTDRLARHGLVLALAASQEPESRGTLDAAWAAAEAALPEGADLSLHALKAPGWAEAIAGESCDRCGVGDMSIRVQASSPAAALQALAARLRDQP
jgi:hypothetical protein